MFGAWYNLVIMAESHISDSK